MEIDQRVMHHRSLRKGLLARLHDPTWRQPKRAIAAFALAAVVATWAAAIQQVRFEAHRAAAAAMRQNENRVGGFEQYLLRTFDAAQVALDQVVTAYTAQPSSPVGPISRLALPGAPRTIFPAAFVADDRGRMVAATANIARDGIAPSLLPHIRALAAAGSLYISPPIRSAALGADYIYILRRLDLGGRRRGVAAVLIVPRQFLLSSARVLFGQDDALGMIGLDGIVRARRIGDRISYGGALAGVAEMRGGRPDASYELSGGGGSRTRYVSRRRLPAYPMVAVSDMSVDSAFARVRARAHLYLGAAAVTTGLLGLSVLFACAAIDQRQRREREIDQANDRLLEAQLIGQIGDWDYDPSRDSLYWSPSLLKMYERDPAEPVSSLDAVRRYVSPGAMRKFDAIIEHIMRTGERQEYELAVKLPSGAHRIRQLIMVPTRAPDGTIIGLHGTDQDITNLRRLESLEAKLVHFSRLDAMNVMAATLAHEINQPLTAALNYVMAGRQLLPRLEGAGKDEIGDLLQRSEVQIQTAGELLRNIRESVAGRPDRRRIAIRDIWREAVPLVEGLHPDRGIVFTEEIAADAESACADPIQIRQVLANLISNAVEAVPAGRAPIVRLSVRRHDAATIAVSVRDNGGGLDIVGDDLFSPFASTKETGMGLGLALSRTIVEAHQGRIWVAQSDMDGTIITFTLPSDPA